MQVITRLILAVLLPAMRWLAIPLLMLALVALVTDGTRILNGAGMAFTSTLEHWSRLAPQSLANAKGALQKSTHPLVWDQGVQRALGLPAFALFGLAGGLLAYGGRRRRRVNIFAN